MIVYKSNKNWFGDIRHLAKSWTMVKVGRASLMVAAYTLAVAAFHIEIIPEASMSSAASVFTFLGVVLSILLVFRTNTAYDRWWEGRKQWGALVNNCRNMALYAHNMLPAEDMETRRHLAKHISNFCFAFVEHLRDGTKLENLIELSEDEILHYKHYDHIPNRIASQIWRVLQEKYRAGEITDMDVLNIRPTHQSLLDILGACERIKKTPIPFSYAIFMKIFITAYALLLPFALVKDMEYWSVLAVTFVFFAFIGIEMMGEEIEDPFGLDCNDLPTGTIASTISGNVYEIFGLTERSEQAIKKEQELYEKIF
ncbi:MAG: bestrophin family protein [Flavobacteriales bacterium]|nr:bestrophin family protein [Flavobacteriales bacterium]